MRTGGAGFFGDGAGVCAVTTPQQSATKIAARILVLNFIRTYQTLFGANGFVFGINRCEPKLILGTEIVFAFPRPSSIETLKYCTDEASIGTAFDHSCGSAP